MNGVASLGTCFQSYAVSWAVSHFGWAGFFVGIGGMTAAAAGFSSLTTAQEREGVLRDRAKRS